MNRKKQVRQRVILSNEESVNFKYELVTKQDVLAALRGLKDPKSSGPDIVMEWLPTPQKIQFFIAQEKETNTSREQIMMIIIYLFIVLSKAGMTKAVRKLIKANHLTKVKLNSPTYMFL